MQNCLIIRAKEEADKTAVILQNKGLNPIIEPIFSVENITTILANKNPQAIIITSSNACNAIINSDLLLNVKIFAIGKQSAQKLVAAGYNNIFYATEKSALSLKNLIIKNLDPKMGQILYFCGDTITLDFKKELEPLGFSIEKIIAYKIIWHQNFSTDFLQKIPTLPINFILFYSQNSVKKFYDLAKNNNLLVYFHNSKILCFSDKIMITAKKLGFKNLGDFSEIFTKK